MASATPKTDIFPGNSRALDEFETTIHQMFRELSGTFGNLNVFCSKGIISAAVMKQAVELATLRNPLLGSKTVKNDQGGYMFTPIAAEEIEFEVYDGEDWETILNTKTYELFQENVSHVKVVFLPNIQWKYNDDNSGFDEYQHLCGLYVVFDHSVCDDNGAVRYSSNILTYLDEIITKKEFSLKNMSIFPGVNHYLEAKMRLGFLERIGAWLLSFGPFRRAMMNMVSKGNAYIVKFGSELQWNPDIEPNSGFVPIEIGPTEMQVVVRKCKENNTTVNGAIQAAYLQAFLAVMSNGESKTPLAITHFDMVDFRRWYFPENDIPADYCMNAAGALQFSTKVEPVKSEAQFWEVAREMSKQTHKMIQSEKVFTFTKLLPWFGVEMIHDLQAFNPDDATNRMGNCLSTSNVGRCDFMNRDNTSCVKMRARYGCHGGKKHGTIFQNYIYTFEGRLFWSVTYEKHVVKPAHAEMYARLVRNWFVHQSPE